MTGPARLENPIRCYDWGSRRALAELQGRPAPSERCEAELWMGAHPGSPSQVQLDAGLVSLLEWIEREPEAVLGARVREGFGDRLPFLFKVLAAERPLSIQAHPDAAQAREGFAREDAAGLPRDAADRNYRDPSAKPEIICALSRFEALQGFRPVAEIRALLERLGAPELGPVCAWLDAPRPEVALRQLLAGLLGLEPGRRERLVEAVAAAAAARAAADPAFAWVERLCAQYPGDAGVLAPLYLNYVPLEPGEALFLEARELHCYLEGLGVELMGNSDNVLRGGLTGKHVDPPELQRVLRFAEARPHRVAPVPALPGLERYPTPSREFELSRLRAPAPGLRLGGGGIEILLCTEGRVALHAEGEAPLELARGQSAVVPAAAGPCALAGEGILYRAAVPA